MDKLNEIKRDALVDRILSKDFQLKFKDSRELYQFFLLDVEMDGCARTSRVLEAISACQLYVHRRRMNLEQSESDDVHVQTDSIPADEWLWRKNYRVWEANRKVFLYPENWLEPDLRDNKTPIFKQVESELLQSTITPDAIENIYRNYLREYAELAKLIVVSTLYDANEDAHVFFARTPEKPYQYYWRKLLRNVEWTPWEKIDLEIEPPIVSGHKHHGKLYLFWIRVLTNNDKDQGHSDTIYIEDNQTIYLEYSFVESNGKWTMPKRVPFHNIQVVNIDDDLSGDFTSIPRLEVDDDGAAQSPVASKKSIKVADHYDKAYPYTRPDETHIRLFHRYSDDNSVVSAQLGQFSATLDKAPFTFLTWLSNEFPFFPFLWPNLLNVRYLKVQEQTVLFVSRSLESDELPGEVGYERSLIGGVQPTDDIVTNFFPYSLNAELSIVHNRIGDLVLTIDNQQFFIRYIGGEGYKKELNSLLEGAIAYAKRKRDTIRLSTTLADKLGEILFNQGLETFLSLDTQRFVEAPIRHVDFEWIAELPPPADTGTQGHLNSRGAQGPYYQELFFHFPFLIAHYLNASQKFADADYWYRRIFDPTASENPEPLNKTDRNWRYIEFRNRQVPKLREILTDEEAIERYKEDPFNPFAIARLRILAFQKAVVMKYIDNLLDWGDHLFAQDTVESINEATMLYIMAADILGDRPAEVGDCETTDEFLLTYQNILSRQRSGSEFLVELENLYMLLTYVSLEALSLPNGDSEEDDRDGISTGFVALRERSISLKPYQAVKSAMKQPSPTLATLPKQYKTAGKASAETAVHHSLAFCIPPNETLLGYWDRVGDRLFKIRNCMNLQGVRRELALFQPPIDPGLLVKAKAAGLSLEDVLSLLTAETLPYRFTYLLEKAKQFAGTVQSFGNSLLSALEKRDTEELTLLRAMHEQELLKAVRKVKDEAVTEATHNYSAVIDGKALATARKGYYINLLDNATDPELAISKNEQDSLDKQEDAKENEGKASKCEQDASGIHAAPSIGFQFSPFVIMVPFHPLGESPVRSNLDPLSISGSTGQFASVLSASATKFRRESSFKNIESSRAATRGGHERRKEDWLHQKALAESEETQFTKQILAAQARIDLAAKDLESHDKQMDQSAELHEFYKDKFTNLGLYTHLATSLSRLYREAYNLAHDMAMKAQRAYQFETDDQPFFIANDNWQADKAGLLAGERLTLQLQQMEKAYLEQTRRDYEITQHFSLALLDAHALLQLRETGECEFSIPELAFDISYPGHYMRRIKSASVTVPCVTRPYTNVSARLTLLRNRVRVNGSSQQNYEYTGIEDPNFRHDLIGIQSIATSTGQNDSGLFQFNFQDERYLPFERAGAISTWRLSLPNEFRVFDYGTISDVILHLSYTAREGGDALRSTVETHIGNEINRWLDEVAEEGQGLFRLVSLKHEFSSQLHHLLFPAEGARPCSRPRARGWL